MRTSYLIIAASLALNAALSFVTPAHAADYYRYQTPSYAAPAYHYQAPKKAKVYKKYVKKQKIKQYPAYTYTRVKVYRSACY